MSKHYATCIRFSGQRASVGRVVCVKYNGEIYMGLIEAISPDAERPIIRMLSDDMPPGHGDNSFNHGRLDLPYHELKGECDIELAPDGCWFWPPRV